MVLNILEEHLYAKEKSLSNGNLASMMKLYEQTVKDVAEFWEQYHETYVLSSDSLRMKCEDYYERAKANSDYEMDQIERRVAKYVRDARHLPWPGAAFPGRLPRGISVATD